MYIYIELRIKRQLKNIREISVQKGKLLGPISEKCKRRVSKLCSALDNKRKLFTENKSMKDF